MTHPTLIPSLPAREKLALGSAKQLSDTELLAVFIDSEMKNPLSLHLAQQLIQQFGDLRAILNANLFTFTQIRGLKDDCYLQLQAAREICERSHFIDLKKKVSFHNTDDCHRFIKRQLRDKKNETFVALFLDSQYRLIAYEELFFGSIHAAYVYPRPLIARVLTLNAAALIVAHNHPSGVAEASPEDVKLTKHLRQALKLVEVQLLDHLIIGDNEIFSILNQIKWSCH